MRKQVLQFDRHNYFKHDTILRAVKMFEQCTPEVMYSRFVENRLDAMLLRVQTNKKNIILDSEHNTEK